MISHEAGNTVEATKSNGLFRKLATNIVEYVILLQPNSRRWMRDLSANAVCTLFSMRLFSIAGRGSQLFYETKPNLNEGAFALTAISPTVANSNRDDGHRKPETPSLG